MENNIFFTVIIPTYNRAHLIENTLKSTLEQTYAYYEIIVVDDGSTDNTEEIIKSINSKRIVYYKKSNAERGAARNFGTKLAKGNYITFLDSDDVFYPNHLEVANEIIRKNNFPEIIHLRYEIKKTNGDVIRKMPVCEGNINTKLIEGNLMSCQGVFLRKGIAQQNLFSEDRELAVMEDWELWLRLACKYKIHCNNVITSAIINHDERSVLQTDKNKLIERIDLFMKMVLQNSEIVSYYKNDLHKFKSSCYTYVALHLALVKKNKITAIYYLLKGIKVNQKIIFSRRFFAILKHLVF
ncbi:MAG: glycosyltransferase [Bacteroidia bacterium]